jgi:uncharacterized protein (TIGR02598 family)
MRKARRLAAFSLVEIAAAIGIMAFAFVALMGLLPACLGNFRSAMDATIGAQIAQRVITDAEQTDFDLLLAAAGKESGDFFTLPVRYFDEQAAEVLPEAADAEMKAIYRVLVRGSLPGPRDQSTGAGFTSLPAEPGSPRFRPRDSIFLTVQVAHRPGLDAMPLGADQLWPRGAAPMTTYRTVITRNGYTAKKKP